MPFKAYYLKPDGNIEVDISGEQIKSAFKSKKGLLWLDITEINSEDGRFLEESLCLHQLAVEDCLSRVLHPSKIDDFDDHIFMIAHGINYTVESEIVETAELDIFIGAHFVISNHIIPLYSVEEIKKRVEETGRPMKYGADFLAHTLLDALVDNILPTIDKMSEVAETIEEEVVNSPHPAIQEEILKLKRSVLHIHRVITPQREIVNRLSRGEFPLIGDQARIYFRDVYDHLLRIEDLNQIIRDRLDNSQATYLTSIANKQNETMKTLAVVATIFLPLTLLAGIYGMNFEYMPELHWKWGYFSVLGVIITAIIVVLWRFWHHGWIAWGKQQVSRIKTVTLDRARILGYTRKK